MAKRRRLTPSETTASDTVRSAAAARTGARAVTRAPIAQVAGDSAERAALADVVRAMEAARSEGRLALPLPLASIDVGHIVRDRVAFDAAEMAALEASLAARGQQTPIEVVALAPAAGEERYGLISGWRRMQALRRLGADTVLAVVRRPESVAETWRAMVEENEIRSPLSFYERARIAAEAADAGLYADAQAAVAGLFAAAPAPKRSKIVAFVGVHRALGAALRFPAAIPEKLGLALARVVADAAAARRLADALRKAAPATAEAERRVLERALKKAPGARAAPREVTPGIALDTGRGRLTLTGAAVDAALARDLEAWLKAR